MSKYEGHTQEPWFAACVDKDGPGACHCGFIFGDDGRQTAIATVHHNDPALSGYDEKIDITLIAEKRANARLIADAPALAERTRRALNKLRYMSSGGSFLAPTHNDIGHLIRILEGEEDKE